MDRLIGGSVLVAIQVVGCEVVRRKDHKLSEIIIGPLSPVLIKSQHASSSEPLFIMESGYTASKFRFRSLTLLLLGISLDLVAQLQMLSQRTPWPTDQSCGPIIHITFFKTFIMHSLSFGGYLLWRSAWLRSCCHDLNSCWMCSRIFNWREFLWISGVGPHFINSLFWFSVLHNKLFLFSPLIRRLLHLQN